MVLLLLLLLLLPQRLPQDEDEEWEHAVLELGRGMLVLVQVVHEELVLT